VERAAEKTNGLVGGLLLIGDFISSHTFFLLLEILSSFIEAFLMMVSLAKAYLKFLF